MNPSINIHSVPIHVELRVNHAKIILITRTGTIYRYIDASRYGLGRYAYRYAWCRIAILLEIRLSINLAHFLPQNKF